MKIDIEILKRAIMRQLDALAETYGGTLEVPEDLYWFVPVEEWSDPTQLPTQMTLGSVADDWAELSSIGEGTKEPIDYSVIWSSAVLRALGNMTIPAENKREEPR